MALRPLTPELFELGMTFDQYVDYVGSDENLARELDVGPRRDYSAYLRAAFEARQLNDAQTAALTWLAGMPGGPAKMLAVSEEWSSDCRRDVPTFARIAQVTGMELRIFNRDGQRYDETSEVIAGVIEAFRNHKNGHSWLSIPLCVFYTSNLDYLWHYTEYPAIYHKDRLVQEPGAPFYGDDSLARLVASPFYAVWTSAAVDTIISGLHRRLVTGAV
jgi:hypothetical protein